MKKSKEEKDAFTLGLLTMLLANIGVDLFNTGGWITYIGLVVMFISANYVYQYVKK